jgi:hypothetical protein
MMNEHHIQARRVLGHTRDIPCQRIAGCHMALHNAHGKLRWIGRLLVIWLDRQPAQWIRASLCDGAFGRSCSGANLVITQTGATPNAGVSHHGG